MTHLPGSVYACQPRNSAGHGKRIVYEWISQNSSLISALANVGMLAIWAFYAQLLYMGFRRERRPRVMINKGVGNADLDAPCLICNMSKEPIFIQGIFVDLETSEGTHSASATDPEEGVIDPAEAKLGSRTRQGPLGSGSCIEVRSFRELIQKAADAGGLKLIDGRPADDGILFRSLTITVVSIYGPEDHPFGAKREFSLECNDQDRVRLSPSDLDTKRLMTSKEKKRVKELLRKSF